MVIYECVNCKRIFYKKCNYESHLNRKFKCTPVLGSAENPANTGVNYGILKSSINLNNLKCNNYYK